MLKSIQSLRGIAAWMVVFHHIHQLMFKSDIGSNFFSSMLVRFAFGVDLFFVISGFIIYNCATDQKTSPFSFLIKRSLRVVPSYWFYTFIAVVITIIYPGAIIQNSVAIIEVFKSMFFIPYFNYDYGVHLPFLTVGWTLNYEMFFYLSSFLSILLFRKYYVLTVSVIIIFISFFNDDSHGIINFYSSEITYEFLIGVYASVIYKTGILSRLPTKMAFALIASSILVIFNSNNYHGVMSVGLPCGVIVLSAVSLERTIKQSRFMNVISTLGDWSYSTYLSHVIIICVFMHFYRFGVINPWFAAVLSIILTAVASAYSFKYIEKTSSPIYRVITFRDVKNTER